MWAFELQDVVPDIVTLGKPIANGFPMAAIVTRREIAEAYWKSGSQYFNTFGGNAVAAAAGLAVLNVFENKEEFSDSFFRKLKIRIFEKMRYKSARSSCADSMNSKRRTSW